MSQNSARMSWSEQELQQPLKQPLKQIMKDTLDKCVRYGKEQDYINHSRGANLAGFIKVVDAMLTYGVICFRVVQNPAQACSGLKCLCGSVTACRTAKTNRECIKKGQHQLPFFWMMKPLSRFQQALDIAVNGNLARLHSFRNFPHKVDMEQPVCHVGSGHLDMIGQFELAAEIALSNTPVEVVAAVVALFFLAQ